MASFGLKYSETSRSFTAPPNLTACASVSRFSIKEIPDTPLRMFVQESSTLFPTGQTMPSPVITTLLLFIIDLSKIGSYFKSHLNTKKCVKKGVLLYKVNALIDFMKIITCLR